MTLDSVTDAEDSRSLLAEGIRLRDQGDLEHAIKVFRRAATVAPDLPTCHFKLGEALLEVDRHGEAQESFERALDLDPENSWALYGLARIKTTQRRSGEALDLLRRAVSGDSSHFLIHLKLGECLLAEGQFNQAKESFENAIAMNETFHWSHYWLGRCLELQGEREAATTAYRNANATYPDFPPARERLAKLAACAELPVGENLAREAGNFLCIDQSPESVTETETETQPQSAIDSISSPAPREKSTPSNAHADLLDFFPGIDALSDFRLDSNWIAAIRPKSKLYLSASDDSTLLEWYVDRQLQGDFVSPNPLVDFRYYVRQSNYWERSDRKLPIERDYLDHGRQQDLSLHWLIKASYVLLLNKALFPGGASSVPSVLEGALSFWSWTLAHLEQIDRLHPLFATGIYRERANKQDCTNSQALLHFLTEGIEEHRYATGLFDIDWYRSQHHHLAKHIGTEEHHAFGSYFHHFCEEGIKQDLSPIPDFDRDYYLKTYPDVEEAVARGDFASSIEHFLLFPDQRRPNPFFDPTFYMDYNPEVVPEMKEKNIQSPLEHFLLYGYHRNYKASYPLERITVPEKYAKALFEKRAQFSTYNYTTLGNPVRFNPEGQDLSIVIPVYNHFNFTVSLLVQLYDCLKAEDLLEETQVIVVDNGSSDLTKKIENYFEGLTILRKSRPIGYTGACLLGAAQATGAVIAFLNNDIEIQRNSFRPLLKHFEDPNVGACAGKIVLTDYTLQEAGSHISNDGSCIGFGRGKPHDYLIANVSREVDYVSGCFLFIRKTDYDAIGGFDEEFSPGYFEETDLCVRLRNHGKRIVYEPRASIVHYEYATYSKGRPATTSVGHMMRNQRKFIRKHAESLTSYHPVADLDYRITNGLLENGKHVLFVDDLAPSHARGSGFSRAADIVHELLEAGCLVTLYVHTYLSSDEEELQWLNGQLHDIRYARDISFEDLLHEIGGHTDIVWLSRTHNINNLAAQALRWKLNKPSNQIVGDTEALDSIRSFKLRHGLANFDVTDEVCHMVQEELQNVVGFDCLVAVNSQESDVIAASYPESRAIVLGHTFEARMLKTSFEETRNLIFFGAFHSNDCPNMDSILWFCSKVLPLIRNQIPDVEFHIAGYMRSNVVFPDSVQRAAKYLGKVDDLDSCLANYRTFVAPTRIAGGIPHKVQHAMSLGMPAVITDILRNQIPPSTADEPYVAARPEPVEFANACIRLYTDQTLWNRVRHHAILEIEETCSRTAFQRVIREIVDVGHKAGGSRSDALHTTS